MRENVFANNGTSSFGYHIAARSGVVATPAAQTDSAGHLVALRNATTKLWLVTQIRVTYTIVTAPTAAQELGFSLYKLTGYSASHTGGNAISELNRTPSLVDSAAPADTELRISNTSSLSDGTHDALTLLIGSVSRLYAAAAATVVNDQLVYEWIMPDGKAIFLANNEGLVVPNLILGGAGSSVRVHFECDIQAV